MNAWLCRVAGVDPREAPRVAWSFALFFCVFASWYVLRPLRDAMAITGDTQSLPRLFLVTLAVSLALTPALSTIVSRFPRRLFLAIAYRAIVASLLVFFVLLRGASPDPRAARAFFVWASVVNLFEIALAWGFMADLFSRAQGLRLFALIGAGGTLGAMLGSLATAALVGTIGAAGTLLVSAALLEAAVRCVRRIEPRAPHGHRAAQAERYKTGGTLAWLARAATSPYFLAICGYMALFTLTSTVLYLEQARIVKASVDGAAARASLFARMDLAVSALALVLQLFFAGRALRMLGVGIALALLPAVTLAGFAALRVAPVLTVLVVCQVARRTLDYALAKPAREVLFTVVQPEDKYKAKSFIDTFVYRSGDAIAAVGFEGIGRPVLAFAMVIACAAWVVLAVVLGATRPRS
jgi:AAA family ATP:ADP antiporter